VASDEWRARRRSRSLAWLPDKVGTGGMTTCWGLDGLGRGRLSGLWSVARTGLRRRLGQVTSGQLMLSEFGACGRQRSVWRWGRSRQGPRDARGRRDLRLWLGWWLGVLCRLTPTGLKTGLYMGSLIRTCFGFGGGREAVVVVTFDGVADGLAPAVGAEGVGVFVLGDVDGLHESLGQVGDGARGSGFYFAADDGGDEASQGDAEIAGGKVVTGEEIGEVLAEFLRSAGAGFLLGVVRAEAGIVAEAGGAATAAIRERKRTQGHAVL
jgi:hypothetical protein